MNSPAPKRAKRLLVVDDEPLIRDLVCDVAEMMGWQVAQAANGLDLIKREDIADMDVILTDMAMPDMSGGEIILWLAKRNLRACVILMSGHITGDVERAQTLANQARLCMCKPLYKPFSLDELSAALTAAAALQAEIHGAPKSD